MCNQHIFVMCPTARIRAVISVASREDDMGERRGKLGVFCPALVISILALALALAPGPTLAMEASTREDAAGTNQDFATQVADFTNRGMGLFPDTNNNAEYINAANRGCNACHDDLFAVDKGNGTYDHITTYVGMKKGTYSGDCKTCHSVNVATTGNLISENIHIAHYSSPAFMEGNGNCWSCHAMTKDDSGNVTMVLYDDLKYESALGGMIDQGSDAAITWSKARGFSTGYYSGVTVVNDPGLKVTLDQDASAEENEFLVDNYVRTDGNDAYSNFDASTWTLGVTGVKEPRTFTIDELKALPQTETIMAQWCAVNGINGAMVDNMPVSGVLVSDLIDACGGLEEDSNSLFFTAFDGWNPSINGVDPQQLIDAGAMICLQNYGHDLTVQQGAPAKLMIPGTIGAINVKNLTELDFRHVETPVVLGSDAGVITLNSSWFDNDGVQGKVGEELVLEGAAYGFNAGVTDTHPVAIEFSLDYGKTWVTVDVPNDFDTKAWDHFTLSWTPREAGTYIIKCRSIASDGTVQSTPSSLILNITE
jgi:DMSO/TMAO reductase YedYZ molybdopterin-dependent catalytic subunit